MQPIALSAFQDNYIWIINGNKTFSCVDPGDATPVLTYAKQTGLRLSNILLTHHHADHTQGVHQLKEAFNDVSVYGPIDSRLAHIAPIMPQPSVIIPPYSFQVLYTPGHTSTHICYFEPKMHWLFCGDTLFSAGCGRVFDGTMQQLFASFAELKALPDDTLIFCGHEYTRKNLQFALSVEPNNETMQTHLHTLLQNQSICSLPSTIELEKKINPFFRAASFQDFSALRELKDVWLP